jgi:hypothetical protein
MAFVLPLNKFVLFQSRLTNINDGLGRLAGSFGKYLKNYDGYRINEYTMRHVRFSSGIRNS